jgi:hypothetical protein
MIKPLQYRATVRDAALGGYALADVDASYATGSQLEVGDDASSARDR